MARRLMLEKQAKEKILEQMEYLDEINSDTVADLIMPHMQIDVRELIRQKAKKKANELIATKKGQDGIRSWFACKDKYVNIEKTKNIEDLNTIEESFVKKYNSLNQSKKKIERQKELLNDQLSIEAI